MSITSTPGVHGLQAAVQERLTLEEVFYQARYRAEFIFDGSYLLHHE